MKSTKELATMTRPIFSQDGTYGSAVCVTGFNLVVFTCACKNERIQAVTCYIVLHFPSTCWRINNLFYIFIFECLSICCTFLEIVCKTKAFLQYRFSVYLCIYLCIWVFDLCKTDLIIYLPKNSRHEIYIHLYHVFSDNEVLVFKWSSHSKYRHNARHQQLRGLKTWPRCRGGVVACPALNTSNSGLVSSSVSSVSRSHSQAMTASCRFQNSKKQAAEIQHRNMYEYSYSSRGTISE